MLSYHPLILAALLTSAYCALTWWWLRPQKTALGDCLIAYASEGGAAAQLAEQLQQQLQQQGGDAALLTLNQLNPQRLAQARRLLVVTSTHGEGEAPENGRLIQSRLAKLPEQALAHLEFAVLALGDNHYAHYCGFGVQLAQWLEHKGAQPLFAVVCVNRLAAADLTLWQQQLVQAQLLTQPQDMHQALPSQHRYALTLTQRSCLNAHSPGQPIYALDFAFPAGLTWQAGDIAKLQIAGLEREYSIASLPSEGVLRLLVRQQFNAQGELGLGSGLLTQNLELGQSADFILRSNPSFYGPALETPMILIGNGTGLAGLRAHLKEREQLGCGENWLIYGERSPDYDLPWNDELRAWQANQHLQQLDLTFSRAENCAWPAANNGQSCRCYAGYVQQVLHTQGQQVKDWLARGAAIYVCGSKNGMAAEVEQRLQELLGEAGVEALIEQGRFCRDVY